VPKTEPLVDRVKPYLQRLNNREISIRAVAAELGVNPNYLGELLKPILDRIESTTKYRENRSKLKESRAKYREFLAKRVENDEITLETAAICANCSIRTIYRYVSKLRCARKGKGVTKCK
jgi:AraC-like DNA-binding protein